MTLSGYFIALILGTGFVGVALGKNCLNEFTCNDESSIGWKSNGSAFCTAHYGGFPGLQTRAQSLAQYHLQASMKFLMLATKFSYWKTERPGFHKLFQDLSDSTFKDAVNILQHMAQRGGRLHQFGVDMPETRYEGSELEALGMAVDIERMLAEKTLALMNIASDKTHGVPDGEFAHFLADDIAEKHSKQMSILAGHVNNLANVISESRAVGGDPALMIYIYDTHVLA